MAVAKLWKTGFMSDAEIRLGDRTWKVHKNILCVPGHNNYFKAAFTGNFMEARSSRVVLDETLLEEEAVDAVLVYLYTDKIPRPHPNNNGMFCLVNRWLAGDYFRVDRFVENHLARLENIGLYYSRILCRLTDAASAKDGQAPLTPSLAAEQIIAALKRVYELSEAGNQSVADMFKPILLRLILCGRQHFPLKTLCSDYPDFVSGWEDLMNEKKIFASGRTLYPRGFVTGNGMACAKCKRVAVYSEVSMLDHVSWASPASKYQRICVKCYRLPTLAEWELVQTMLRREEKLSREQADLEKQKADLDKQQAELQRQLVECNGRLETVAVKSTELRDDAQACLAKSRGF